MRLRNPRLATLALAIYAVVAGVLAVLTALMPSHGASDPIVHFPWIVAASTAVIGSVIAIAGVWSTAGVYAAVFGCFHFGLIVLLTGGEVAYRRHSMATNSSRAELPLVDGTAPVISSRSTLRNDAAWA